MKNKYFTVGLFLIFLVGLFLRTVNLSSNPPHLGNDEISVAFDSYSIRTIGRDEHGKAYPLSFKSHQTYKAPLYAYLNIPFNYLFGNNEYGVRFLSVVSGSILILVVSILAAELAGPWVGLAAGILMAMNPKAITVSRIAFESNLAVLVMTAGVWTMYLYKKTKKLFYLILAGVLMGFSIWGYHTQWGLTPMLAVALPLIWRKEIPLKKWWLMWLLVIMIALPIAADFLLVQRKDIYNRASSQIWLSDGQLKDYLKDSEDGWAKKSFVVVSAPIFNYLDQTDLAGMFGGGIDLFESNHSLEQGWFLLGCLPLFLVGMWKGKIIFGKNFDWLLAWFLLCPVVPALTLGGISSVRNISMLVPVIIIMAGGGWWLYENKRKWFWGLILVLKFNFVIFAAAYYLQFPRFSADGFQYGYKQAWEFIKPIEKNYDLVVVEGKFGRFGQFVGVPHLYFGYFGAFPVEAMQKRTDVGGTRIDKFWFRGVDWNDEEIKPKTLYVVSVINPTSWDKMNLLGEIKKLGGDVQFLVYEVR